MVIMKKLMCKICKVQSLRSEIISTIISSVIVLFTPIQIKINSLGGEVLHYVANYLSQKRFISIFLYFTFVPYVSG